VADGTPSAQMKVSGLSFSLVRLDDATKLRIYRFTAAVNEQSGPTEVLAEIAFHEYDVTSLSVRLDFVVAGNVRTAVYSHLRNLNRNHFWLYATPPADQSVEVLGIRGMAFHGGAASYATSAEPHASAVQIGISEDAVVEPRSISVIAQLVPSGILVEPASLTHMGTGEVKREIMEEGSVEVSTVLGTFKASSWLATTYGEEFGNKTTTMVERATVSGDLQLDSGVSLWQLNEQFRLVLWDICLLLGFCYRCQANYYQIQYWHLTDSAPPVEAVVRRRITASRPRRRGSRDELINFRELREGGLNQLYQAFVEAPARADIERSIAFLASSYVSEDLAPAYFYAYAALETAVAAAAGERAYTLGRAAWDRLRRRIESEVDAFVSDENLDEGGRNEVSNAIKKKLPELRRSAVNDRVKGVCETLGVETGDLWPSSVGFEAGIEAATTNRNLLVHAARADFPDQMNGDLVRLTVLTERVVAALLRWPREKLWVWYDQDLRWVNVARNG